MAEACHRYSAMFIKGVKDVCEKNMAEAFKYSLKVSHDKGGDHLTISSHVETILTVQACELGNLGGCVNVSMMYSKGDGTDKNPVAAKE